MRRFPLHFIFVVAMIVSIHVLVFGQQLDTSPGAQTGKLPFGSYFTSDIDSIGLYNGNLSLDIPLVTLPGREISWSLRATYNAQKWQQYNFLGSPSGVYTGGWHMFSLLGDTPFLFPQDLGCVDDQEHWVLDAYWTDGLGTKRRYTNGSEIITSCTDTNPFADYGLYSVNGDGSLMHLDSSGNVTDIEFKDGTVIDFRNYPDHQSSPGYWGKVRTANGNFILTAFGILGEDTLGRTGSGSSDRTSSTTYYVRRSITDANGNTQTYQFNYSDHLSVTNPWLHSSVNLDDWLTSIDLPNGKHYTFEYDHAQGFLTKVTLPTGGYIKYVYPSTQTAAANDYVIERRISYDGSNEQPWTYTRSNISGTAWDVTVGAPDGSMVVHKFDANGLETATTWKRSGGTVDRQILTTWANSGVDSVNGQPFNPAPTLIITELFGTSGYVEKRSTFSYNSVYHDIAEQHDTDWYPLGETPIPLTCTKTAYHDVTSHLNERQVKEVEVDAWDGSTCGAMLSKTKFDYDQDSPSSVSGDVPGYESPSGTRMNLTTVSHYTTSSTHVDETFAHDVLGNVVSHTVPGSLTTGIGYTDAFGSAGNHYSYAFPTTVTSPMSHTTTMVYNYATGLPVSTTDERGLTTSQTYDLMNRVASVTEPGGLVTTNDYDDATPKVTVSAAVTGSLNRTAVTTFDKFYRPTQTISRDVNSASDIVVDTHYDTVGRVSQVSEPYRSGDTEVYTTSAYDSTGRPTTITNPDSSTVSFSYAGNVTTTTDEAGNVKRTTVNALGQLTKVEEPDPDPIYAPASLDHVLETGYTYYLNGALASVTQSSQTRTFTRDFLGQLSSESHPETGTTSYAYDSAGRLHTRTDARGIITTYAYDNDSRLTATSYNDSSPTTPTVSRTYDGGGHTGYLTSMTDGAGSVTYGYDYSSGFLTSEARAFTGVSGTFTTSYSYDAEGKLTGVTYPSGRVVAQSFASGSGYATSRLSTLTAAPSSSGTPITLVSSVTDNAAGEITSQTLGNGVVHAKSFNARFQLTGIHASLSGTDLLNLSYAYGSSNNGAIRSRTDSLQPEHSVGYSYDSLQRLSQVSATSPSWSINWGYDIYGNRKSQSRSGIVPSVSQSITYTNNKMPSPITYDANGNLTFDNTLHYDYDGENRLRSVESGSIVYVYDGNGQRVKRTDSVGSTFYMYGLTGLMSEFTAAGTGATAAASTDRLQYRVGEQTGTGVLVMNSSGTVIENNRVLPFGESWQAPAISTNNEKFTTYNRDSTTGLDYAMSRDYAKLFGSFYSADPSHIGADLGNPQSWNAYSYVVSDPINGTDSFGLYRNGIGGSNGSSGGGDPPGPCFDAAIGKSCGPPNDIVDPGGITKEDLKRPILQRNLPGQCRLGLEESDNDVWGMYRAQDAMDTLKKAAGSRLDPRVLAAIGVRESNFAKIPQFEGGMGMGVFQISVPANATAVQAQDLQFSANFAANLLSQTMRQPFALGPEMILAVALRGYNTGPNNRYTPGKIVGGISALDRGTAGTKAHSTGNYITSVMHLMDCF